MTRLALFILAFFSVSSFAGPIGKAGPSVVSKGGNAWEVVYGAGNTVSNTRTWSAGSDAGSLILADVVEATISNSKKAQMVVSSPIAAKAVGRMAFKVIPFVGQASLAYDIWQAIGCEFVDGQIRCLDTPDPFSPNSGQWVSSLDTRNPKVGYGSGAGACKARCEQVGLPPYGVTGTWSGAICQCVRPAGGTTNQGNVFKSLTCPSGSTQTSDGLCVPNDKVPKSEDDASDHWGKNAPNVPGYSGKAPGIVQEAQGKGIPADAGSPQVSGPPSAQGQPSVTTQNKPDGTVVTITTTPTYNITYQGNTYNISTVNNIQTVTTNPDGSTSTENTTEEPSPDSVAPPADPDMPEVPVLYEKKYPDGPTGVWNTRKSELQNTPIFSFLSSLVPSTGDGGCPSWQLPVMYGINNTAVVDISIPCWIWSAIRAIFIVTALISCRRIIFGG